MNEVQEDTISETNETDYKDLQSLLEAANLSEFNPETGYTEEKQDFVKFESFFDISTTSFNRCPKTSNAIFSPLWIVHDLPIVIFSSVKFILFTVVFPLGYLTAEGPL